MARYNIDPSFLFLSGCPYSTAAVPSVLPGGDWSASCRDIRVDDNTCVLAAQCGPPIRARDPTLPGWIVNTTINVINCPTLYLLNDKASLSCGEPAPAAHRRPLSKSTAHGAPAQHATYALHAWQHRMASGSEGSHHACGDCFPHSV